MKAGRVPAGGFRKCIALAYRPACGKTLLSVWFDGCNAKNAMVGVLVVQKWVSWGGILFQAGSQQVSLLPVFSFTPASVGIVLSSHGGGQALLRAWEAQAACTEPLLSPCMGLCSGCPCCDSHQNLPDSSLEFIFLYITYSNIICPSLFLISLPVL